MDEATHRFDLVCQAVVDLVTDYSDGALDDHTAGAVDRHLHACPACAEYLTQIRATIAATGRLNRDGVHLHTLIALVLAFRDLLEGRASPDPSARSPSPTRYSGS